MPDEEEGITLKATVAGLVRALSEAKYLGDLESARLQDVYRKEKYLSQFTVPAFAISDVDVELKFAIVEPEQNVEDGKVSELKIKISPEFLKGLDAHQVSVVRLKISPINLKVYEEGS